VAARLDGQRSDTIFATIETHGGFIHLNFFDVGDDGVHGEATDQIRLESAAGDDHRSTFLADTVDVERHLELLPDRPEFLSANDFISSVADNIRCVAGQTVHVDVTEPSLGFLPFSFIEIGHIDRGEVLLGRPHVIEDEKHRTALEVFSQIELIAKVPKCRKATGFVAVSVDGDAQHRARVSRIDMPDTFDAFNLEALHKSKLLGQLRERRSSDDGHIVLLLVNEQGGEIWYTYSMKIFICKE